MTFADQIIHFINHLQWKEKLPDQINVLNPFEENAEVNKISREFYQKFYSDQQPRKLILGINPGRLGAGATGIPFTDTKRLESHCGIHASMHLHEPSSVFVYEVIDAFGGPEAFYQQFYISSVCPLGFVKMDDQGRVTNYNYYDSPELTQIATPFIIESLKTQLTFGLSTKKVFVMGTGKNFKFFRKLNQQYHFFDEVIPLEHPRYVMQYKAKSKQFYIDKYLKSLNDMV